jgi:Putative Flp pilus-assembly TadE/G-like
MSEAPRHYQAGRRGGPERGQMLPMLAVFSTVLVGAMALAIDLSVTTHYKRTLQNVTDAAALAGARQLPVNPTLLDEMNATRAALTVVHNSYQWQTGGANWVNLLLDPGCPALGTQCSVTICAGLSGSTPCTETVSPGSAMPFVLTVNAPPLSAAVAQYNGDAHRVEVSMRQKGATFFAGLLGQSDQDASESVALHFAAGQPFPFALYSRTYVSAGNQGEVIDGNIYADRYLAPQSSGQAGICAAPQSTGAPGFVYLGYPQLGDGTPPYQGDGQSTVTHAPTIGDGVACGSSSNPASAVSMSANPRSAMNPSAYCAAGYPGDASGAAISFDDTDGACEVDPALLPPPVAALPNLPSYATTVCGSAGIAGLLYQPGEYRCSSGAALTVDHLLAPGIYEIDAGATGGCDVVLSGAITTLPGVTFYLKGGAGICATIPSGVTIVQTPYNAGTGDPGDGRYAVLSDQVAAPSLTLRSSGSGSSSGAWNMTGVIWMPTGTVTINNKVALEETGQVVVGTWNDQSGNHPNPAISYNASFAPEQNEALQLAE